ncbi:hypothetical protein AB1F57_13005 [Streptococcus sp. ZY1909104]|uniref:hypothetical protein n=1 Tax=Streptococcus sp. ZY1909104 TaxID=3233335 RepID=UPI00349FC163
MDSIYQELDDLEADKLPIEFRRVFAKYLSTQDKEIVDAFINLSLTYSNGRYTDFIRAYMYYELIRRKMWAELEELCKKL